MSKGGRHRPFHAAIAAAALSCLSALWLSPLAVLLVAANAFFVVYLALMARRLVTLPAKALRGEARSDDLPVALIFAVALGAVAASLAALFVVLNARDAPGGWTLALALSAVPLGWLTIHVMAAAHYAHLYWQAGGKGLEFPGTDEPGGIEFVYFALVIGMTAQTSDVVINTSQMRSVNVVHAVVSFFFNTVLVAAAVNAAVAMSG